MTKDYDKALKELKVKKQELFILKAKKILPCFLTNNHKNDTECVITGRLMCCKICELKQKCLKDTNCCREGTACQEYRDLLNYNGINK